MRSECIVSNIKAQIEKKDTTSPYANIMFTSFKQFEAEARLNVFKNSVRTSKGTPHFTITKID
jgi:hypothetical protein